MADRKFLVQRSRFLAALNKIHPSLKTRLGLVLAKAAAMRVRIHATGCPAPVSDRTVPDGLDGRAPARRHLSLRLSTSLVDEALSIYVSVLYAVAVALKLQSLPIPLPHVCRFAVFPCKLTFSLSNIPSTGGASIMSLVSQEEMWNSSRLRMTTQRRAMASRCLH